MPFKIILAILQKMWTSLITLKTFWKHNLNPMSRLWKHNFEVQVHISIVRNVFNSVMIFMLNLFTLNLLYLLILRMKSLKIRLISTDLNTIRSLFYFLMKFLHTNKCVNIPPVGDIDIPPVSHYEASRLRGLPILNN